MENGITIKEGELKILLSNCFSAGQTYQNGEYSEYHGGKENEYPNFSEWFNNLNISENNYGK